MREGGLKRRLFRLIEHTGIANLAARLAPGVPILAYHGVSARPETATSNLRRLHVSCSLFASHLAWLREHRRPLSLAELRGLIETGGVPPRNAVVVTFDDGYRNFATQAWPLLLQYDVPATLFVPTDGGHGRFWQDQVEVAVLGAGVDEIEWAQRRLPLRTAEERANAAALLVAALERMSSDQEGAVTILCQQLRPAPFAADEDRDRLSWPELRALQAAGLEIGSHADRHQALTRRPDQEVTTAVAHSHAELTRELGARAFSFSYPFGARSSSTRSALRAAGFTCAVTGVPRLARHGCDLFDLPRLLLGADDDLGRLQVSLSGLRGLWQGDPWPEP
jgi:peptidoglycan/xylan/chitin deacetylase (PgdA/CDA1 family)